MEGGHEEGGWGGGDREGDNGEGKIGTGHGEREEGNGEGGNREGETGKRRWRGGQQGGGDGEGSNGVGEMGREAKDGGKHIECLGGMRLQFFLTLLTRATPGTSASIPIRALHKQTRIHTNFTLYNLLRPLEYF